MIDSMYVQLMRIKDMELHSSNQGAPRSVAVLPLPRTTGWMHWWRDNCMLSMINVKVS